MHLLVQPHQPVFGLLITDKNGINNNYKPYSWGKNYELQYKKWGQWHYLEPKISENEIIWNALSYSGEFTNGFIHTNINFNHIYGELKNGIYRIVKSDEFGEKFYSNEFKIERDV